jgi:hypothetical protein
MSSQQFRLIPMEKRPGKLNLNQKEVWGASETVLIPDGDYLFMMENRNQWQLLAPKSLRSKLITDVHGDVITSHKSKKN